MVKRTLPITGKKYFVLYLGWLGESKDRLSLVYPPDEADGNTGRPQPGFFRITGKKYFVLYLGWLGEGNFLVQILCGGSVVGHD